MMLPYAYNQLRQAALQFQMNAAANASSNLGGGGVPSAPPGAGGPCHPGSAQLPTSVAGPPGGGPFQSPPGGMPPGGGQNPYAALGAYFDPMFGYRAAAAGFLGGGVGGVGGGPPRFFHEEPKPQHSYIGLIAMAILSTADRKMVLSDIYQWILDNYPYFRTRGPGWRNSIRHNLSLNDCFVKSGRSANGKGHYWAIHEANVDDFKRGDFRRRRAQRKVRKAMGFAVDDEDSDDSACNTPAPGLVGVHHRGGAFGPMLGGGPPPHLLGMGPPPASFAALNAALASQHHHHQQQQQLQQQNDATSALFFSPTPIPKTTGLQNNHHQQLAAANTSGSSAGGDATQNSPSGSSSGASSALSPATNANNSATSTTPVVVAQVSRKRAAFDMASLLGDAAARAAAAVRATTTAADADPAKKAAKREQDTADIEGANSQSRSPTPPVTAGGDVQASAENLSMATTITSNNDLAAVNQALLAQAGLAAAFSGGGGVAGGNSRFGFWPFAFPQQHGGGGGAGAAYQQQWLNPFASLQLPLEAHNHQQSLIQQQQLQQQQTHQQQQSPTTVPLAGDGTGVGGVDDGGQTPSPPNSAHQWQETFAKIMARSYQARAAASAPGGGHLKHDPLLRSPPGKKTAESAAIKVDQV